MGFREWFNKKKFDPVPPPIEVRPALESIPTDEDLKLPGLPKLIKTTIYRKK